MQQSQGELISFNNFFSISTKLSVSDKFTSISMENADTVPVLFMTTIDSAVSTVPYANIQAESEIHDEREIFFSMHSVFRIESLDSMSNESGIYRVQLKLTSDNDPQLRCLTDRFEKEIEGTEGWYRIDRFLMHVNQLDKAFKVLNTLLNWATNDKQRATY
jgi:hypothetical protein